MDNEIVSENDDVSCITKKSVEIRDEIKPLEEDDGWTVEKVAENQTDVEMVSTRGEVDEVDQSRSNNNVELDTYDHKHTDNVSCKGKEPHKTEYRDKRSENERSDNNMTTDCIHNYNLRNEDRIKL